MEITDGVLRIGPGLAATFGIIVLFVGKRVPDSSLPTSSLPISRVSAECAGPVAHRPWP